MHSGFASLYLIPYTMNLRVLILVIAFMCWLLRSFLTMVVSILSFDKYQTFEPMLQVLRPFAPLHFRILQFSLVTIRLLSVEPQCSPLEPLSQVLSHVIDFIFYPSKYEARSFVCGLFHTLRWRCELISYPGELGSLLLHIIWFHSPL